MLDKIQVLHDEAEEYAKAKSSDLETQVGAIAVYKSYFNPDRIGSYFAVKETNRFVDGAKGLPNTRPNKYEFMQHAEANLVFAAANRGLALKYAVVVCTLSPCQNCIRTMFQAGIREVYFKNKYHSYDPVMLDILVTESQEGDFTKLTLTNHPES
jgi:deoxycytidylate deaminase